MILTISIHDSARITDHTQLEREASYLPWERGFYSIAFGFFSLDRDKLPTFKGCIRTRLCSLRQLTFILNLSENTRLEHDDLQWFNLDHPTVRYEP